MKIIRLVPFMMFFCSQISFAQTDSTYNIKAWGSEPFWTFEFKDTIATYNSNSGHDSTKTYFLLENIYNVGFTNEYVDTYIFTSTKNESLMLILVKDNDCPCGYDMSGNSNLSAYIYLTDNKRKAMLLGCAKIISRK
jgi:uncharacterized membrane protein